MRFANTREHDILKTPTSRISMGNSNKKTDYILSFGFSIGESLKYVASQILYRVSRGPHVEVVIASCSKVRTNQVVDPRSII